MESRRVTKTLEDQWMVERQVREIYDYFYSIPPNSQSVILELQRDKHFGYLTRGLTKLGPSFSVLDANRPWLCYWTLHSIALLGESIDAKLENDAIDFLTRCQDKDGGYGGGPGQMPHLATTYAAVNSLITLGGPKALSSINREKLYTFLLQMKDTSGGFRMHDGGEVDVRACYTAISVASILNIVDDELIHGVGNYILSCQTYEGGIAGEPGAEAHGGYTFCGLAAMILINEVNRLDLPRLIDWVVFRQGVEGGFQGRTNKLVDGCYSFWQGAVAFLIQRLNLVVREQLGLSNDLGTESADDSSDSELSAEEEHLEGTSSHVQETCPHGKEGQENASDTIKIADTGYEFINRPIAMQPLFDSLYLQQYVLLCSQMDGGFRDKPGKGRDHYHTCYCLSGLSIAQYSWTDEADSPPLPRDVFGPYSRNLLEQVHPLFNVELDRYYEARKFFSCL
ncbi:Protein farnesyltransferase subunit beta [Capsicum annuum]|uniref:Protein farnesyltransferase subunit beta n=1 Tax=Capsicum annuum TaxID=4072 RepID=A0A2G3AC08_CAPAN|nr:protein farnesyltransferase subunit beta [Capsicum annuum]KAF3649287.1 Protein farnesyltransferase subunit beta [Capsicum annuum]PHT91755.1 Protein farnesyltransferase subunit beta [Capsicum annuum]